MTTQSIRGAPGAATADAWRLAGLVLAGAIAAVLVGFHQTFWSMIEIWWRSETFSHAFLIAPISLYLVWRLRDRLARLRPAAEPLALVLIAGLAVVWLLARFAGIAVVEQFSVVLMLLAVVLAVVGRRVFAAILFPMAYLLLMVPFGEFLVPPLQDITADFVVVALRIVGIPVYSDGIFLQTPTGSFQVAEACAGLRFLIATVALALLFAYLAYHQWWRRIAFMILALIIPVIANGFRAFGIVLIAYLTDNQVAVDVDHIVYGWVFLTLVTLALLGVGMLLRGKGEPPVRPGPADDGRPVRTRPIAGVALAAAVVSLGTPALATALLNDEPPSVVTGPAAPALAAPWTVLDGAESGWTPEFLAAPWTRKLTYGDGAHTVDLFVAYYPWQAQGAEIINPHNRIAPVGDWERLGDHPRTISVEGEEITVTATRIVNGERRRVVLQWYWIGGRMTGNRIEAKLLELWGVLSGDTRAATIVVATDEDPDGRGADPLASFLAALGGLDAALDAAES